jgi:hypothetical protein
MRSMQSARHYLPPTLRYLGMHRRHRHRNRCRQKRLDNRADIRRWCSRVVATQKGCCRGLFVEACYRDFRVRPQLSRLCSCLRIYFWVLGTWRGDRRGFYCCNGLIKRRCVIRSERSSRKCGNTRKPFAWVTAQSFWGSGPTTIANRIRGNTCRKACCLEETHYYYYRRRITIRYAMKEESVSRTKDREQNTQPTCE